jgi:hypothetical protein
MFLVFVHPVKADGSIGIRSMQVASLRQAIALVHGITCKWSICVYGPEDSESWIHRIDSHRNTHGTKGIVSWVEHKELQVFLADYNVPSVWEACNAIKKRFKHNFRAFCQSLR